MYSIAKIRVRQIRLSFRIWIMAVAFVLNCCLFSFSAQRNQKIEFLLPWSASGLHAPFYVAKAKGWFAKEGLDVRLLHGVGSCSVVQRVGLGKIGLGYASTSSMLMAAGNGQPLTSVGVGIYKDPSCIIFPSADPKRSLKAIKGKYIAGVAGDSPVQFFNALLVLNRISPAQIRLIQYSFPQIAVRSFAQGRTNAFIGNSLSYCAANRDHKNTCCDFALPFIAYGWDTLGFSVIANKGYLQNHARLVKPFMKALKKGFEFVLANPDESFQLMRSFKNVNEADPDLLKRQIHKFVAFSKEHAPSDLAPLDSHRQDWVHSILLLKNNAGFVGKENPENYYTNDFLPGGRTK